MPLPREVFLLTRSTLITGLAALLLSHVAASAQTLDTSVVAPAVASRLAEQPSPDDANWEQTKFAYFETLGEKGWDIPRPTTAESVIADAGGIRSLLARYGIGFLGQGSYTFAVDTLHQQGGPQSYNGERPTFNGSTQFAVDLDLGHYGLSGGSITVGMGSAATSWKPLGPRATSLLRLFYYQSLFNGRIEVKAGYVAEGVDFYGTFVGGNVVSGLLGPNANLIYQLGASRTPLTAPGANIRFNGPDHFYVKSGIQRSINPAGPQAEHDFNPTGILFRTPNTGVLFINEVGYNRAASDTERELWIRGGALNNTSPYTVFGTPRTSTNYAFLGLADTQVVKTDRAFPARGVYAGATFITGDPTSIRREDILKAAFTASAWFPGGRRTSSAWSTRRQTSARNRKPCCGRQAFLPLAPSITSPGPIRRGWRVVSSSSTG